VSKKHAAEILDVSVRTIDRYISRRIVRVRTMRGGSVRIPIGEIDKFFKPSVSQFLNHNLKGGDEIG